MLKKFLNLFIVFCLFSISSSVSFSQETDKIFKIVKIKDKKTLTEFARTIIPEKFYINSKIVWERDFETPVKVDITVNSPDKNTSFEYYSQRTFADICQNKYKKITEIDTLLRTTKKKFETAEQFNKNIIKEQNPNAKDIKIEKNQNFQDELKIYLANEYNKKVENLKVEAKTDRRITRAVLYNPYVEPYMATFSYTVDNTKYKQTFITLFTSIDYDYTKKTSYDVFEKFERKLWNISELYSYKAPEKSYDEYYDDFIIFVLNTIFNKKTETAVELVKKQMKMELNPAFVDIHTGSSLKNMPSDLYKRYYEPGKPIYSETKNETILKPSIEQSKWIANINSPQNKYLFKNDSIFKKQPLYIDKKYQNVYYNSIEQKFLINKSQTIPDKKWKKLKIKKEQI